MASDRYGILIVGNPLGLPTPLAGQWVKDYDLSAREGRGEVEGTTNPRQALAFKNQLDAWECWRQVADPPHETRPDGKPNRPLTAYTVEIGPLPS